MAGSSGYGVFRILKARVDLGHGGEDGKIVMYALYDNKDVRLFHFRHVDGEIGAHQGIKAPWRPFTDFVDEARDQPVDPQLSRMAQDLEGVLRDAGIYDLKETNITKIRYMEKVFSGRITQLGRGEAVVFIKIEGITALEANELMDRFPAPPSESDEEGPDREEKKELPTHGLGETAEPVKTLPKLVFSCAAVLDPVRGTPASEVRPGDLITIGIPEDSPLYGTMKTRSQEEGRAFDGKIDVILTGVSESDSERLILEFDLGDNVMAVVMAQKSLRIKTLSALPEGRGVLAALSPVQMALAAGALILMMAVLFLLLRG